jgi:4-alpha-glucanotransferase
LISGRYSGILLHPTSLPSPDGIGDLGADAYRWVDFLSESGCTLWQVLPLSPTGFGDSPYQCFSAFAGNPYLISFTMLLQQGLIHLSDLEDRPEFNPVSVDYGRVIPWKLKVLTRAFQHYKKSRKQQTKNNFIEFQHKNRFWLEDFGVFMAVKEFLRGIAWNEWPSSLKSRTPKAIAKFKSQHANLIERQKFYQFLFFEQWSSLREYANLKHIRIIGDIPIFIALDSVDTWAFPNLFSLNCRGLPNVVAGVPPDYFSPTGQYWGNPLYRWIEHERMGYQWWVQRIQSSFSLFDVIRLDHFRGFVGCWEIPAKEKTAIKGRWVKGPGGKLFRAIKKTLGDLPIIAEDLGEITPDVTALRDQFHFPGMKVLQFAFGSDATNPFLPHNYPVDCVAYTGTHDNDTAIGWFAQIPGKERNFLCHYLNCSGEDISWELIRAVWSSVAAMVVAPMQDVLKLGSSSRMNFPNTLGGNWRWRFQPQDLNTSVVSHLREMNDLYGRTPQL